MVDNTHKNFDLSTPHRQFKAMTKAKWRILIIDDLPVWATVIRDMAALLQSEVSLATNLSVAMRMLNNWEPHLILLDMHMPRDKWEPLAALQEKYDPSLKTLAFCEQITSDPKWSQVMVVMTSVEEQSRLQELASTAGAHAFFTKDDFNGQKLQELLRQIDQRDTAA